MSEKFIINVMAKIFEPLDEIDTSMLIRYSEEMQKKANDNIEQAAWETIDRFARFWQMAGAITEEMRHKNR